MEPAGSLFFGEGTEIFIAVQKNLVLIAVAGENIFDQRLCLMERDGIFIEMTCYGWEAGGKDIMSVLQTELFIKLFSRKNNAAVKLPDEIADLFHMVPAIGAA